MPSKHRKVHPRQVADCPECEATRAYYRDYRKKNLDRKKVLEKALREKYRTQGPVSFPTVKHCPGCKRTKEIEAFAACNNKSDGRQSHCRECRSQFASRRDKGKWSESSRRNELQLKYNLTPESWDRMYEVQGGCCACCGDAVERTALVVDHCHVTGRVRGLLCNLCNGGLGMFKDDPVRMQAGISYLVKDGLQPERVDGCAEIEKRAEVPEQVGDPIGNDA